MEKRRARAALLGVLGVAVAVGPAPVLAQADDGLRIESEVKLSFPPEEADAVFGYVTRRFGEGDHLAGYGPLRVQLSEELFTDVYFDTPDWAVYEGGHGVRHRSREIPGDPSHRKDGRELLQVKTSVPSDDGSGVRRGEYKFDVTPVRSGRSAWDRHPLLGIVEGPQRVPLHERLTALGLRPEDLAPVLTLEQRRRRVYIADPEGALATLTVDEVDAHKAIWNDRSAEVELELNEIRFTRADEPERERMEAFAEALREDLLARFEAMRQDQTPKYQKAVDRFAARVPAFRSLGALHLRREHALVGALVLGLVVFTVVERRRQRRGRPLRTGVGLRASSG